MTRLVQAPVASPAVADGTVSCFVVHIDNFGNVITSAKMNDLRKAGLAGSRPGQLVHIRSRRKRLRSKIVSAYHQGTSRDILILEGSQGYVEVALKEADAAKRIELKLLDKLTIAR